MTITLNVRTVNEILLMSREPSQIRGFLVEFVTLGVAQFAL